MGCCQESPQNPHPEADEVGRREKRSCRAPEQRLLPTPRGALQSQRPSGVVPDMAGSGLCAAAGPVLTVYLDQPQQGSVNRGKSAPPSRGGTPWSHQRTHSEAEGSSRRPAGALAAQHGIHYTPCFLIYLPSDKTKG